MAALSLPPHNSHMGLNMPGSAPRFLCFPRSVSAPVGTHAVLRCHISGDPPPSVLWERVGNIRLELGERCYAQRDGDWYQLVISDLRLEDSGHYMCRASNWSGEGYAGAKLTVTLNNIVVREPLIGLPNELPHSTKLATVSSIVEPSAEPNQQTLDVAIGQDLSSCTDRSASPDFSPHFLLVPSSQRLACGQSAELSCRVSGKPEPTIRWEKDGRNLEEIFDGSHYRLSPDGHSLNISHVRPPDAGVYVCRASNSVGQSLAAAVLLVDPTPRQGPEPMPGDPPAQVKVFTVNEGKHAKLRCLVTGKPRPEIVWRKDGRAVSPGRRTLIYEDRDGHFILKVLFCRQQDRGLYVCGASNTAGNTLSAVMVHVREVGDRFPAPLRDIAVREGQDAMLECSVPDGTRTSWYLEDQRLHPGKRHLMEEHGPIRRLIIRGAQTDDDGVYVCQTHRGAQSIAEVAVRGPIVKKLPRRLEVAEGGNAAFCAETESETEQVGWTLNGHILSEDQKTVVSSFGRTHVLVLVGVTQKDSGIVQFHAGLSESSCQLRVKARGSSITPASGEPVSRTLDAGQPVCLSCQVPSSGAKVRWMKDGHEVEAGGRVSIQSDGRMRRLLISSSDTSDTGTYSCHSANDSSTFTVTVTEPPVKIINTSDDTEHACVSGEPVTLSCELSRENALVRWYRDGVEVEESESIRLESDGRRRRLIIISAKPEDAGEFVCDTGDDSVFYNVTVTESPVKIINTSDDTEHACVSGEPVVLSCELSRENALVRWYRDGVEVEESESIRLESDGRRRRLIITSAKPEDAGEFVCDTGDDSVFYNVTVTEPPVKIINTSDDTEHACVSGEPVALSCELSRENALVRWYRDGVEVEESESIRLESDGRCRRLIIISAKPEDAGEFVCDTGDDSVFYNVTVTEPPVKILNPDDDTDERCLSGKELTLSCEVSRENAPVRWYKDGERVEESERIRLVSEGRHRRLVILSTETGDSGEFVCDAKDDSIFYNVTVTEPPVKIVNTSDDVAHKCLSGERVVLSCQVSRQNAHVCWYKDGMEVEESEGVILESDGKHRRLIIPRAQVQDSGEFTCDARDDCVFYNVVVTEPPVKIVNTSDDTELAYLSGERVDLSCEVSRENAPVRWYKDGAEVEDDENIRLESDGRLRRLVILCAQTQDSGEFVCDARDDSVFYYVKVTEPPVKFVNTSEDTELAGVSGEPVELSCEISRDNARVRWYRDGVEVEESENISLESDGHYRRLVIKSAQPQDSGEFVCDAGDDAVFYSVLVTEPPTRIVFPEARSQDLAYITEERVELVVEVSNSSGAVRWFKDGLEVDEDENLQLISEGPRRCLILPRATVEDSGEYICDTDIDSVTFDVKISEPPAKIINCSPSVLHVTEGDPLSIECDLSREPDVIRWLKDGEKVTPDGNLTMDNEGDKCTLSLLCAQPENAGEYKCDVGTDSRTFQVHVDEAVVVILERDQVMPRRVCTVSEDLRLALSLSRSDGEVRWYKDGERLKDNPHILVEERGADRSLTILGAARDDAGEYLCDVRNDSFSFYVTVGAPPVTIVGNSGTPEHHVLMTGDDLILACELSRPNFKVRWLRDGEELVSGGRVKISARGAHRQLTVQSVRPSDSGTYTCDAGTDQLHTAVHVEAPRLVEFITELQNITVLEGDTATFKCVLTPEDVILNWELNGSPVNSDRRASMASNGLCHSLTLHACRLSDSGTITANAEGIISRARLRVQEAHVMFTQGLEDVEVEEEEDVTFQVQVTTERAEVHWVKQGMVIQPSSRFTLQDCGQTHTLTIHGVQSSDRGRYSCESLHDRTDGRLNVLPKSISVRKGLKDVSCEEGSDVEFSVELSHEGLVGEWWKGGVRLTSDDRCVIKSNGRQHVLCFTDLRLPDSAVIAFTTDTLRTTAHLTVSEHPLTITQPPQDFVVNEGGLATFQCEVSKQEAVVTWSKDGEQLVLSSTCRMFSVGRRRILHLNHCDPKDAGTYTCHVGDLTASAVLRVLEQEPQMLKDLQDVQIVENDNAAFICEVSCAQAKGEWFKNGEKIKVTSTTKIRQEGRRHFLLICGAQCEDSGDILFRARRAESRAKLQVTELPVRIVKSLRDKTAMQGHRVILECKVSPARARVTWLRGTQVILPSDKYQITSEDAFRTLVINNVTPEDEDVYIMKTSDGQTSARLLVEGLAIQLFRSLRDVKVTAPDDACFECEVSIPLSRPPQWSLNGIVLHNGPDVVLEARGIRHKITLRNTHPGMSGTVRFTAGKTRSEAQLSVQEQ
ncbi:obscurin-like protein 1 isoform X4 [Mixophyes fleayi]|uniref:obscurin-like protein 1 isoform X4 n=1 Tax=Mixophyes fleayi TaxID=3061075 RepID=UPI003F4E1AB5